MLPTRVLMTLGGLLLYFSTSAFQMLDLEKMAVSVNKFTLFPDSTFYNHSNIAIAEGETFELVGETKLFHEDDSQTQKFKWYEIKLKSGKQGWVFGNNIAVYDSKSTDLKEKLVNSNAKLSAAFYNSKIWTGSITGFDATTDQANAYIEKYLVFTNAVNESRYIQVGREQVEGKSWVEDVQLVDLNSDTYQEVIIQLNSQGGMSTTVNQYLEIFTMKNDDMRNIFSEKINLGKQAKNISPINRKFFDVEDGSIRVAYIDYFECKESYGGSCMEYVTYTYVWDASTDSFETLYPPSRTNPVLKPKSNNLDLFPGPGLNQTIGRVGTRETLKLIGQEDKYVKVGDTVTKKIYFLVKTFDGKKGYIESTNVEFIENDYSKALNMYYQQPAVNVASFGKDIMAVKYNGANL